MLADHQDAMGYALWDELHGRTTYEIVERDDGYVEAIPTATWFAPYEAWHDDTQAAMEFVRGRVLDVGVGAARHALHLQEKGHDVVGIDNSPKVLEVARLRGLEDARGCAATQVAPFLGRIDTILLMGNNFGLMADRKRTPWLLARLASIAQPDARIVAQTRDVHGTDNPEHRAYQQRNRERGRMPGQIRLRIRHLGRRTPWSDYLMVSPGEMQDLLRGTPWRIAEILARAPGGQYTAILERR